MPRPTKGIRLYLKPERRDKSGRVSHAATWIIRETGRQDIATGFGPAIRNEIDW